MAWRSVAQMYSSVLRCAMSRELCCVMPYNCVTMSLCQSECVITLCCAVTCRECSVVLCCVMLCHVTYYLVLFCTVLYCVV